MCAAGRRNRDCTCGGVASRTGAAPAGLLDGDSLDTLSSSLEPGGRIEP
jgi:hypothetical protein